MPTQITNLDLFRSVLEENIILSTRPKTIAYIGNSEKIIMTNDIIIAAKIATPVATDGKRQITIRCIQRINPNGVL